MKQVRYGIIGLGSIFAIRHRPVLEGIPEASIEMVCDVDAHLAGKFGNELGCRHTADYRDVISDADVDAVMVLTPPEHHEDAAVAAAQAGKHVFCEKPLASDLDQCRRIVDAADQAGVLLCVGENHVFSPFVRWCEELRDQGTLGQIRRLRFQQSWSGPPSAHFYHNDAPGRGGGFLEDGIHWIALSRRLLNAEPHSVTAVVRIHQPRREVAEGVVESQVEDGAVVVLEFESALATLETSWTVNPGTMYLEISGTGATVVNVNTGWAGSQIHAVAAPTGNGKPEPLPIPDIDKNYPGHETYEVENRHFTQAVLTGGPAIYSGRCAMRDVEILQAAYESSEKASAVRIPPPA